MTQAGLCASPPKWRQRKDFEVYATKTKHPAGNRVLSLEFRLQAADPILEVFRLKAGLRTNSLTFFAWMILPGLHQAVQRLIDL